MIKDIIVNIPIGNRAATVVDYAVSVASMFTAHLAGTAFIYEPIMVTGDITTVPAEFIDFQLRQNEDGASSAIERFDEATRRAGVSAQPLKIREGVDKADNLFAQITRRFDVAIVSQVKPDKPWPENVMIEAALFKSGRPVVVVPYSQTAGLKLDRIMVCWDGGANAARAVSDALPFLVRAKSVEICIVAGRNKSDDEVPGADIAEHVARHGVKVDVVRIVAPDIDVANAILCHAAEAGTDFLVMGGYGHSRIREFILGGATREVLASMTLPTLLAH